MTVDIISRAEWGARAPKAHAVTTWGQRREVIVHYSEGPATQSVRSIQDFHMNTRGWADIGYNFLVDVHGRIYEGRGWLTVGAHAPEHNTSGIGVCMIGRNGDATDAAKRAIRWLYDEAVRRAGHGLKKLGHRDVYSTSCPGDELYAWVRAGMPAPGAAPAKPTYWDVQSTKAHRRVRIPYATPTLQQGSTGARVKWLQDALAAMDYDIAVDGDFGSETRSAVVYFQEGHLDERGLQLAGGTYGHHTARALFLAHGGNPRDAV